MEDITQVSHAFSKVAAGAVASLVGVLRITSISFLRGVLGMRSGIVPVEVYDGNRVRYAGDLGICHGLSTRDI